MRSFFKLDPLKESDFLFQISDFFLFKEGSLKCSKWPVTLYLKGMVINL